MFERFYCIATASTGKNICRNYEYLKKEFDVLDKDRTGVLTLEEATNWCSIPKVDEDDDVVSLPSSSSER